MFKKLAAITATLVCCLGNPAGATPRGYSTWQELEAKLNSIDVTVVTQQSCAPQAGVMATYNPFTNVMCISDRAINSDTLLSTVNHEIIHVVQDCIEGMSNGDMGSVTRYLSDGDKQEEAELDRALFDTLRAEGNWEHVQSLTNNLQAPGAWIETEAYALQNNQEAVNGLLDMCN